MLLSLPFPFVLFQFREFVNKANFAFGLAALVLVMGYLVFCWEDLRDNRPFSREMLIVTLMGLILCLILAPVFSFSP
jgi:hypothetical protein